MKRAPLVVAVTAMLTLVALVGCSRSQDHADPTWVPQANRSPVPIPTPVLPDGNGGGPSSGRGGGPGGGPGGGSSSAAGDPAVVATRLNSPTGLAVLPDGSALVGERATGRIVAVQPVPNKPVRTVRTLTGLDASGGGGLLDLALSKTYAEDGLVIALLTTRTDLRVVHFTLGGPVTPILTGLPRGSADNSGRLLVLADGSLLVGIGDTGRSAAAGDPASLAGKVLHVSELGRAAPANPTPGSPIWTSGHHTVNGLCTGASGVVYQTEDAAHDGELNRLEPGRDYGWPDGGGTAPLTTIPDAPTGGCAVIGNRIFVAVLGGTALLQATIDANGTVGAFTRALDQRYGRLRTVVAAPDGSLWLTTSNRDGHGTPVADDERVLHITPSGGGGGAPV